MKVSIWCVLLVVTVGLLLTSGCGPTLVYSKEDRAIRWRQNVEADLKTIPQDIELWMLMDRPTRLTAWRVN